MNRIKVLVIDDSAFMRKLISDMVNQDERCEVIGEARNGLDGLEKIKSHNPDVVTLDINMPRMNGLEMLKYLNTHNQLLPVIMISSYTEKDTIETIKGLELGAVDFITKPKNNLIINKIKDLLISKIIVASGIERKNLVTDKTKNINLVSNKNWTCAKQLDTIKNIVVIGTSTGGPRTLQKLLSSIPHNINAGILIVQHMPAGFTKSLSNRLNQLSKIEVKEAEHGEIIKNGVAYIAQGSKHLKMLRKLDKYYVSLTDEDNVRGHKPSVDVLFNSVSENCKNHICAVILTGMGSDGCIGIQTLKQKNNAFVIAQDEDSCVVYGMPKAVVDKGLADEVLSIDKIATSIIRNVGVI